MNSETFFVAMSLFWGISGFLGGLVGYYCFRAYRSGHSRPILLLGLGVMLISLIPAVMWWGLYWATDDLPSVSVYCAAVVATGFALVLASVRIRPN
jgi:hypothetical protein